MTLKTWARSLNNRPMDFAEMALLASIVGVFAWSPWCLLPALYFGVLIFG